jgi:hypothetical protein
MRVQKILPVFLNSIMKRQAKAIGELNIDLNMVQSS